MKVYILMVEDVSDGTRYTNNIDVYLSFDTVKQEFDKLVKEYKEKNDFSHCDISESYNHFYVESKDSPLLDYLYIDIIEKTVIED